MSKLVKILMTNSWNNDESFKKEMSLGEALEDIRESAYEDEDFYDYHEDYPTHIIDDFVNFILYCAKKDFKNGYTYEYRGCTYQPIFKGD